MYKKKSPVLAVIVLAIFVLSIQNIKSNNPIIPGLGVCDPHIRIFNNKAYLFATHDEKQGNTAYTMNDWWLWSSSDLITWTKEFTLDPANTYVGPWNKCYAADGATRNGKYYFYFSKHSLNTGVAVSTTGPGGPYVDALGKQLTNGWDPTVYIDDDANKTPYIIFGVYPYKIAKLNEDMVSFAEPVRTVTYDPNTSSSWTTSSDGNFVHKHNGLYYLNQHGQKYGTSSNIYGPYTFRGTYFPSWNDHGTFFVWNNQDYLAYGLGDTDGFFRKTNLTYVYYKDNGDLIADTEIANSALGVGQYDSKKTIQAEWYFATSDGTSKNENVGGFEVRNLGNNSYLYYPNIKNLAANALLNFRVSSANSVGGNIEVHEGTANGTLLGSCVVPNTGSWTTYQTISCSLTNIAGNKSIYLVFKGTGTELVRFDYFTAQNAGGNIDAFSQIEAEDYNTMSGIQKVDCSEGGQKVGYIENGDYIVFNNVDFGAGAASFDARVASGTSGGSIEIRLDGLSGPLVGTCITTGTSSWSSWTTKNCSISGASGIHNLYLKFTGASGYLFDMNWFKFNLLTSTTDLLNSLPGKTKFTSNFPNPFSTKTTISYQLGEATSVRINIYNILGEKVAMLVNKYQDVGNYSVEWNGKDNNGLQLQNGLYLTMLETDNSPIQTMKSILFR